MSEADLLARIDAATAETCHACGRPLRGSVSPWFCDEDCQRSWTAHNADIQRLTGYREPSGGWADDQFHGAQNAPDEENRGLGYGSPRRPRPRGILVRPTQPPPGALVYEFPRWPERTGGFDHRSEILGTGQVTLLSPNGDPAEGESIPVSARAAMQAFVERDPFESRLGAPLTYVQPPMIFALHLDAEPGVMAAIREHATPDWDSGDLTLHPFALTLAVDADGKRYHFTFPRLDYYGDPGDSDPWWRARANPQWTERPDGMHEDATYWFVMEPDTAPVPVSVTT